MKTSNIFLAWLLAGTTSIACAQNFKAETNTSKIEWVGKKVTGQHNGEVKLKSGDFTLKDGNITSGNFVIDMKSIVALDLEGEWKQKLEGHLKSADFFDVEKSPTATFILTKCEVKADDKGNTHLLTGNLTIKGISNQITIPARVSTQDNKFVAIAEFSINRTDYNIKYGSGKFFQDLGDKMIYDDFDIKLNLAAISTKK